MNQNQQVDLGDFLDLEIFPDLWGRLDTAFPDFGFVKMRLLDKYDELQARQAV